MSDTDALSDQQIVARTLDGEAGDQGYAGQQGVANVIMKRAELGWQGETTLRGVCLHPEQFDCWIPGKDRSRIMAPGYVEPPQCMLIAGMALKGTLRDITGGADSYEVTGTGAYWARGLMPSAVIQDQSFYITRKIKPTDVEMA